MSKLEERSAPGSERVRDHFREKASSFDELYGPGPREDDPVQKLLRPGLFRRREFTVAVVRSYDRPRVLDVGCGSGRIAEHVLDAGASEYVGVDFSEPMLDIARRRLEPYGDRVKLVTGDFLTVPLDGKFDVIVGLGLFDYQAQPEIFARRMHELCSGSVVASFPKWTLLKGPVRKVRYEVINNCPIFNYTERELRLMFGAAGFNRVEVVSNRSGYFVRTDI